MRKAIGVAGIILAASLGFSLWLTRQRRTDGTWVGRPVAVAPVPDPIPPSTPAAPDRRVLPVPLFKQWDPAWGDDALGDTREKMRYAGCTVSCVAMTFTHLGVPATPKSLNDWLRARGGFTPTGLLIWSKAVEYTGGRVRLEYAGEGDAARIDRALAAGRPAIVKVMLPGNVPHWVLVVGTEGREYLVNDPLGLEKEPVRLSAFGGRVHAMRIFAGR
jgi:hypothetical protein